MKFSVLHSVLFITPYIIVWFIFQLSRDKTFFVRPKSYYHLDQMIAFTITTIILFLIWNNFYPEVNFLGLKIDKSTTLLDDKILTFLGIAFAVIGWLYAGRFQFISSIKNHSIQILMNARLSESYTEKFDNITKTVEKLKQTRNNKNSLIEFKKLNVQEKLDLRYVLNFYEYIAIGIKNNEFDEFLLRQMMKSQLINTHTYFEHYIEYLRNEQPTALNNFSELAIRWKK
ncbi:DUF4760 domain-containing protein [Acinetobacter beijerinckii]|nr:DUF4760 domain-containing protein [Acinetobacter beijerinckii]